MGKEEVGPGLNFGCDVCTRERRWSCNVTKIDETIFSNKKYSILNINLDFHEKEEASDTYHGDVLELWEHAQCAELIIFSILLYILVES